MNKLKHLPNYNNSILNLTSSLMKHYNLGTNYKSNELLDSILKTNQYKKIVLLVLDGLGCNLINKHCTSSSVFKKYQKATLTSVFPTTTASATTALRTGRDPFDTGWLGWHLYYGNDLNNSKILFKNIHYYDNSKTDDQHFNNYFDATPFFKQIGIPSVELFPDFFEGGSSTFEELLERATEELSNSSHKFIYAYWTNPDDFCHHLGTNHVVIKKMLKSFSASLKKFYKTMDKDTLVILTADHGLTNVKYVDIAKYSALTKCYAKLPCGEPRATHFFIKDEFKSYFYHTFINLFNQKFVLLTKDEYINSQLSGLNKPSDKVCDLIGDFIAISNTEYCIAFKGDDETTLFKGSHSGLTPDELNVPLIILKK